MNLAEAAYRKIHQMYSSGSDESKKVYRYIDSMFSVE